MPWELLERHGGQLAGLGTSAFWTLTALFFHAALRRLSTTIVNLTRIVFAVALLGVTHRALTGLWIPHARMEQVLYLAASGILGLSVGDQALLTAYRDIGPRLALLVMTTAPLFASLFGLLSLGERLGGVPLLGIGMTIGGVAWVLLERHSGPVRTQARQRIRGVVLAVVAAMCQAGGLLLSKRGIGHGWLSEDQHIAAQTATLIRMVFAGLGMLPFLLVYFFREQGRRNSNPKRETGRVLGGLLFTAGGSVTGPFLGVWLSLVACDLAPLGVAQTLCSLAPVFILPFATLAGERITLRAVLGAVLAVAGTTLLFSASQ